MMKKREIPRPTEGELELLGILWERGPSTVRDIFEAVNTRREVVYTGVLKLLQIMAAKGLVLRDERERAHVYSAAVSQAETEVRFLRELSDRFFSGSTAQLAMRALELENTSQADLAQIRKLIADKQVLQAD
jgi:BlaI family transcriptional regulator, penicillinase repressor